MVTEFCIKMSMIQQINVETGPIFDRLTEWRIETVARGEKVTIFGARVVSLKLHLGIC